MEAIKLCRLDTPIIFIEARINLSRFVVTGCAAKTSATVTFPSLNLISLFRSEERRVGKECRFEWLSYHLKKHTLALFSRSIPLIDHDDDAASLFMRVAVTV